MAVKTITVQNMSRTVLLDYTMEAIETDGMKFLNTGKEFIIVKNIDATATTVTVVGVTACDEGTVHSIGALSVANGKTEIFGPISPSYFSDDTNYVSLTVTGTEASGGTIAVIKLPN